MANELKISVENNEVLTGSRLNGMDADNTLATGSSSYTATEDCFVYVLYNKNNNWGTIDITIDGKIAYQYVNSGSRVQTFLFPLKKGQVISCSSSVIDYWNYVAYGVKR